MLRVKLNFFITKFIFYFLDIVHRDLKPENVLFTEDERVKICDFGSSKFISRERTKSTPYIVSRYYRSPELLLGSNTYDDKIDIFATGCIMAELFTMTPIFPGKTEGLQFFEHMCVLGKPTKEYLKKFNLPTQFQNFFDNMDEIVPYDLTKLLNKSRNYYDDEVRQAADLLSKVICWEPSERLSAAEALRHPFLLGVEQL
jgi:serine/threonine protein kinase